MPGPWLQVVAPVRETAAQALGAVARPLAPASLPALLSALRQLSEHPGEWEVRHGGLLGLKYVLAARAEGVDQALLEAVLPATIVGLQVRGTLKKGRLVYEVGSVCGHDWVGEGGCRGVVEALLARGHLAGAVQQKKP